MRTTVLLFVCIAVVNAGTVYRWRRDSNWLNNGNWVGGTAPVDGHVSVRFPPRFSTFNNGRGGAVYLGPTNCASGASSCPASQQDLLAGGSSAQGFRRSVRVQRIVLPASGKLALAGTFRINFARASENEQDVTFKMPRREHMDWNCAANWAVARDTSSSAAENARQSIIALTSESLSPPCSGDAAYFPPRSSFLVDVPAETFIRSVYHGNPFVPAVARGDPVSMLTIGSLFDWDHQFASGYSGQRALNNANFEVNNCPRQCPTESASLRGASNCAGLCFNSCPALANDPCNEEGCPREAALQGLLTRQGNDEGCTVPLYARVRMQLFGDDAVVPRDFVMASNGYTQGNFQTAAQELVSAMQAQQGDRAFQSITMSMSGVNVDAQVTGRLPKDQDHCLRAYYAGDSSEDCIEGETRWFTSGVDSSNSANVKSVLRPAIELLALRPVCQQYEVAGDFSMGYCWCDADTRICSYTSRIDEELECALKYGTSCGAVNNYEFTLPLAVNTDVSVSTRFIETVVRSDACFNSLCEVAPFSRIHVGPTGGDGSVLVGVTIAAASMPSEVVLTNAVQDGLLRNDIVLNIELSRELQTQTVEEDPNSFFNNPDNNATTSAAASTTSSGGGDVALYIGIVAVLVVVAVVYKRQKSGSTSSPDRVVVAFENPSYDKTKGDKDESQGLYDEPAFKNKRQNPMYDSQEDISSGGYLDVAPDDDE